MSLATQITLLAQAIGVDIKALYLALQMPAGTFRARYAQSAGEQENITASRANMLLRSGLILDEADFISGTTGTIYTSTSNGAGAGVLVTTVGGTEAVGVLQISTGTTSTGRAVLHTPTTEQFLAGTGELATLVKFKVASLSTATQTYTIRIGFGDNQTGDHVDSPGYLEYTHSANGGNWVFCTANNSSRTKQNSSVPVVATGTGSTWNYLKIITNASGTSTDFYMDGVLLGSISTNIPTASGRASMLSIGIFKSVGTAAALIYVDRVRFHRELSDAALWRL